MKESLLDEYLNLLGAAKLPYFLRWYLQIPCLVRLKILVIFVEWIMLLKISMILKKR